MERIKVPLVGLVCALLLSGCVTTALYGAQFQNQQGDSYSLQIAFGGLPITPEEQITAETSKVLDTEARKFIDQHPEYTSYTVVSYIRKRIPSAIVYQVDFIRKQE